MSALIPRPSLGAAINTHLVEVEEDIPVEEIDTAEYSQSTASKPGQPTVAGGPSFGTVGGAISAQENDLAELQRVGWSRYVAYEWLSKFEVYPRYDDARGWLLELHGVESADTEIDPVPWSSTGSITAVTRVALWSVGNSKMRCPSFDLPAGGMVSGGTCPGATLGQTLQTNEAVLTHAAQIQKAERDVWNAEVLAAKKALIESGVIKPPTKKHKRVMPADMYFGPNNPPRIQADEETEEDAEDTSDETSEVDPDRDPDAPPRLSGFGAPPTVGDMKLPPTHGLKGSALKAVKATGGKLKLWKSICGKCFAVGTAAMHTSVMFAEMIREAWTRWCLENDQEQWIRVMTDSLTAGRAILDQRLKLKTCPDPTLDKYDIYPVRLHSSGDFFSQDYADMWVKVINRVGQYELENNIISKVDNKPKTRFWAPTRTWAAWGPNAWSRIMSKIDPRLDTIAVRASSYHVGDPAPGAVVPPGEKGYALGAATTSAYLPNPDKSLYDFLCPVYMEGTTSVSCAAAKMDENGLTAGRTAPGCRACWTAPNKRISYTYHI